MSHQFKTTKQRKNKHYKRRSKKIQNPPMEDKNRSILYSFRLIIFFIYTLEKNIKERRNENGINRKD